MITANIIGRIVASPSLKHSKSGTPYIKCCVASDVGFGESKTTLFINITGFGKIAEKTAKLCKKGNLVYVIAQNLKPNLNVRGEPALEATLVDFSFINTSPSSKRRENQEDTDSVKWETTSEQNSNAQEEDIPF